MNTASRIGLTSLIILAVATGIWLNRTAWHNRRLIGNCKLPPSLVALALSLVA